jgi:hypothetical protein
MHPASPSTMTSPLRDRARALAVEELARIPWLQSLDEPERERAQDALIVTTAQPGDYICRIGRPVTYWFGLVDGLLKMNNDDSQGPVITFTGLAPGGWFGEGTALKHEPYRYNVQALRKSHVAGIPIATFDWLIDHSLGFNRFVMKSTAWAVLICAWRATWRPCSIRCSTPMWAAFCASRSRNWPTWWVCPASGSTRRSPRWPRSAGYGWNTAVFACSTCRRCAMDSSEQRRGMILP